MLKITSVWSVEFKYPNFEKRDLISEAGYDSVGTQVLSFRFDFWLCFGDL